MLSCEYVCVCFCYSLTPMRLFYQSFLFAYLPFLPLDLHALLSHKQQQHCRGRPVVVALSVINVNDFMLLNLPFFTSLVVVRLLLLSFYCYCCYYFVFCFCFCCFWKRCSFHYFSIMFNPVKSKQNKINKIIVFFLLLLFFTIFSVSFIIFFFSFTLIHWIWNLIGKNWKLSE